MMCHGFQWRKKHFKEARVCCSQRSLQPSSRLFLPWLCNAPLIAHGLTLVTRSLRGWKVFSMPGAPTHTGFTWALSPMALQFRVSLWGPPWAHGVADTSLKRCAIIWIRLWGCERVEGNQVVNWVRIWGCEKVEDNQVEGWAIMLWEGLPIIMDTSHATIMCIKHHTSLIGCTTSYCNEYWYPSSQLRQVKQFSHA